MTEGIGKQIGKQIDQQAARQGVMLKWLWLTGLVVVIDLGTKYMASSLLEYRESVPVTSFFSLTLSFNTGAAFSFLADQSGWQRWFFIVLTSVVCVALFVWIFRLKPHERWLAIALSCVLGGALGNLYDRVALGYVVDFLHFHYFFDFESFQWYFNYPVFNFADTFIFIGAAMLILDVFRSSSRDARENESVKKTYKNKTH